MILHYQFRLDRPQPCNTAYPLYAALLERADPEFGRQVHAGTITPVSQYVSGDRWHVSLFGAEAAEALSPVLENLESVYLRRGGIRLGLSEPTVTGIRHAEQLLEAPWTDRGTMHLLTPTTFKSAGAYQLLPTQRLVLQSLVLKWNACFGNVCPIEDSGGGLEALAENLVYRSIRLNSDAYSMKHVTIPGALGSIAIDNRLDGFHRQLLNALLVFGTYSGLGIKTALGMGGMKITAK